MLYLQQCAVVMCYVMKVLTCSKKILFASVPTFGQKSKEI